MSGNVGGQDGNQINIKLYNGKTVNLKKLDKLIGKSTEGSVFARFDTADNGGNANNVFDEAEINRIKNTLLQYQASGNSVSQDELNMMFGYGQIGPDLKQRHFDVNKLTSLIDSLPDDDAQPEQSVKGTPHPAETKQVFTNYTVQPGDTPEKLAQKFGLQGDDAEAFIKHLQKQTNKKGWFTVGQKITLLGEHSEALKNMADYSEDAAVLDKRWANTESGKKAIAAEEARKRADEEARLEAQKKKPVSPPPPKDTTPASQRLVIASVRNNGKAAAAVLKEQISWASFNDNTRAKLAEKVTNQNVAYVLEAYPDLVTDIDDEWGMDVKDVKKYVVEPLNKRLRELGMNKHCLPNDLSKFKMEDLEKACGNLAALIRKTDAENGYVFKPAAGDEGKVHQPRLSSQRGHVALPSAQKSVPKAPAQSPKPAESKETPVKPEEKEYWKYLSMEELSYPEPLQDRLFELRRYGIEVTVNKTRDGYRLDLNENAQNIERYTRPMFSMDSPIPATEAGPQKVTDLLNLFGNEKSLILDKEGNLVSQSQKFADKTVVTQYDADEKPIHTETNYKKYVSYSPVDKQRVVNDDVATDIEINRPEHLNEAGTVFADSLEDNKAALMKTLGLDNEQYNNLANLAMGIAEQETHFGASRYTTRAGETNTQWRNLAKQTMDAVYYSEDLPDFVKDTVFALGGTMSSSVEEYYQKYTDGTKSYGMTQVKVDEFIKDSPVLKKQLAAFGINSGEDIRKSPEKQAIATIIILNNKRIVAESSTWQKRLADNNANITDKDQQITQNDLIALLYNGNSSKTDLLKKGQLTISDAPYARNVRSYVKFYYEVSEDELSRHRADALGTESQGNNGRLGTVIFMPTAYTTDVTNSKEDLQTLEEALNNNSSIPQQLKEQLIMAARKNEIAFGYGLSADEASSITAADATLILDKLNGLKGRITNLVDPVRIRTEAQKTQDDFRSDYLESRQVIVNDGDVPAGSIIPALGSGDIVDERLDYNRETVVTRAHRAGRGGGAQRAISRDAAAIAAGNYRGFAVQKDLGVNPYDANGNYLPQAQRELAEYASQVTKDMGTGGLCLTGIKASFESAGIIEKGEVVYPKGHKDWGKPIENAKDLRFYLDAHPEKFEEVKYVSLGNGTSRELNASDIKNLPAGYIGVFIPGDGFEDQAGHAFITNGNGQGYADEVDNLRWDDFKSSGAGNGKGEHGTFKIYRLKV